MLLPLIFLSLLSIFFHTLAILFHLSSTIGRQFEHLIALGLIIGFQQLGVLDMATTSVMIKIVDMFIFQVKVQSWIAQVLFGAEAFETWALFVLFRLGTTFAFGEVTLLFD